VELFQAIESFESTFIEVHQASNIIWRVRSFKSRIKTYSFLGGGIDIVSIIFAEKGSQYNQHVTISKSSPGIIHVASLKIVDAPLLLIFMMQQRVCCVPFWLNRRPIVCLWQCGTMQHL